MLRRSFIKKAVGVTAAIIPVAGHSSKLLDGINNLKKDIDHHEKELDILEKKTNSMEKDIGTLDIHSYKLDGSMPLMDFGNTGMKVSRLGFGSHLKAEMKKNPELRDRMIKMSFDYGVNTFDVYDHGGYEQFAPMGKSIRGFRNKALVSLCVVKPTNQIQEEIDGALKSFFTDYIDMYRLYSVDDDRVNLMVKNKMVGKIRAIGVVSHDTETMMKYVDNYGDVLDYVMIVYNFYHNKGSHVNKNYPPNDYSALIPRCDKMGLGIFGIKPMASDNMILLAEEKGYIKKNKSSLMEVGNANIAQGMLRHIYQNYDIDCTMPSINSMQELMMNLEATYNPAISQAEKSLLNKITRDAESTKSAYLSPQYKFLEKWHVKYEV